jgi:hypothetical protein
MLIGNSARLNSNPMRLFGGVQGNNDMQLSNFHAGALRNQSIGFGKVASTPRGTQPPYVWIRATKSGDLSTFKEVSGEGLFQSNLLMGKSCSALLDGTGTIPTLSMSMAYHIAAILSGSGYVDSASSMKGVVSLLADLVGQGEIPDTTSLGILAWCITNLSGQGDITLAELLSPLTMSADISGDGSISNAYMVGIIHMLSELVGGGTISPDLKFPANLSTQLDGNGNLTITYLKCLAWCLSELTGIGTLNGSDLRGKLFMGAEITSAGELVTAQSCASAVWEAIATLNNDPNTMGNKLNSAASAGDPWITDIPGSYPEGSAGYIIGQRLDRKISEIDLEILSDKLDAIQINTDLIEDLHNDMDLLMAFIKNEKRIEKIGDVWCLRIRNSDNTGDILNKVLKDKDGNNITDVKAGILMRELASDV